MAILKAEEKISASGEMRFESGPWIGQTVIPGLARTIAGAGAKIRVYFMREGTGTMQEKIALIPVMSPEKREDLLKTYLTNLMVLRGVLLVYAGGTSGTKEDAYILECSRETGYRLVLYSGQSCKKAEKRFKNAVRLAAGASEKNYPVVRKMLF